MLFKGKVALVTGAASGIGRAVALNMAREGASVLVADQNVESGNETVQLICAKGGSAAFYKLDAADAQSHIDAVSQAQNLFGHLNIACNNAGISVGRTRSYHPMADVDLEDWHDIIGVNLNGVFYGMRAQIPAIIQAKGGAIVNTASIMGQVSAKNLSAYVTSKHGVIGLTRSAALDYAEQGVRINAVGPGYIETPMLASKDANTLAARAQKHPLGRLGRPEEVAETIVWLASDRSSFTTGAYYPIDGGYLAQ